ncbi:MAG: isochorismatase family protein [Opitutales bacterium]|nr:isochorismatase family protein [Opitutales bacterium]
MNTPGVACLLIDLQEPFLKSIPEESSIRKRCGFVIRACQLLGIPVYFTTQIRDKLGATLPELKDLAPEAPEWDKSTFSAWPLEALQSRLKEDGVQHLLVGGIETPICVYQTVIGAHADGFETTLLSDCIGCRRAQDGDAVTQALTQHGILSLPSETVFYSILGEVSHPAFRDFTRLVKTCS